MNFNRLTDGSLRIVLNNSQDNIYQIEIIDLLGRSIFNRVFPKELRVQSTVVPSEKLPSSPFITKIEASGYSQNKLLTPQSK